MKKNDNKNIIGLREFRENTNMIIEDVNGGASYVVFKKNKPIFKISPVNRDELWETVSDFTKIEKNGVDVDELLKYL